MQNIITQTSYWKLVGVEVLGFEIWVTLAFEFEPARGSGTLLLQTNTKLPKKSTGDCNNIFSNE